MQRDRVSKIRAKIQSRLDELRDADTLQRDGIVDEINLLYCEMMGILELVARLGARRRGGDRN